MVRFIRRRIACLPIGLALLLLVQLLLFAKINQLAKGFFDKRHEYKLHVLVDVVSKFGRFFDHLHPKLTPR
ncbi:MAG: hypothetical protein AAF557_18970, partial [Pseudomonadota bacterium]